MKQTIRYDFGIARLEIEGLPDISLGQKSDQIGIILNWKLNLIGFPQLEGKKQHLEAFVGTISQYSRNYISGVRKSIENNARLITIKPHEGRHALILRSTQEGVRPLDLKLDDAELVDLTKCFDLLRLDSRILIDWDFPSEQPLTRTDLCLNKKAIKSLFFPLLAGITLIASSLILLSLPLDMPDKTFFEEGIDKSEGDFK